MNEIQKSINSAYQTVSTIPVAGDAADKMAVARAVLREAYKLAGSKKDLWAAHKKAEKAEQKAEKEKSDG